MQRLFSAFPGSWPGVGLLLLRVATAAVMFKVCCNGSAISYFVGGFAQQTLRVIIAGCFVFGFCLPFAATAEIIILLYCLTVERSQSVTCWFLILVIGSLLMIGPGAWSIDALLFGRRRIDVGRR